MPITPILFTIPNFITAGSGRVLFNIAARLDRRRFAPAVCVLRRGGKIETELEALGIPVFEQPFTLPVKPYATLPRRAWQAARAFRRMGFRIWHSFHYADDYTEPLVARLSGAQAWLYTKKAMSWGSRAWLLRSYLASRIVADNSEMPARFFNRAGLRRKVRLIHHGLPLDVFSPGQQGRLGLRPPAGTAPSALSVGCVAQLVPVKDHPNLIRAASLLENVHVYLAGVTNDPAYQRALESLAAQLGAAERVHFCGSVQDVPAFLNEIDVFVLPTQGSGRMEGCPVALLEAMACGRPCVATDIPGSRDLIEHESSGLLVPPSDPQALAGAVRRLAESPELRAALGANARRRAEARFSIEREVQAHEALYAECLGLHG